MAKGHQQDEAKAKESRSFFFLNVDVLPTKWCRTTSDTCSLSEWKNVLARVDHWNPSSPKIEKKRNLRPIIEFRANEGRIQDEICAPPISLFFTPYKSAFIQHIATTGEVRKTILLVPHSKIKINYQIFFEKRFHIKTPPPSKHGKANKPHSNRVQVKCVSQINITCRGIRCWWEAKLNSCIE